MKKLILCLTLVVISINVILSQPIRKDKGEFIENKNEAWDNIKKDIDEYNKKPEVKKLRFTPDFSSFDIRKSISDFKPFWHNNPVMQSSTGTCWAFASTSFLESEVNRLFKKEVKLSEMFTVYHEYIAKVKRYIKERGNSLVSEGAQTNSTIRVLKEFGAVPISAYTGLKLNQKHHAHDKLIQEINTYLEHCKKNSIWNEEEIIENVESILNHYLNEPPKKFTYEGREYTPKSFASDYLKLNPDEYVDVMSIMESGFWKKTIYDVPDNWSKADVYYNIPLDDYMKALNNAVANRHSVAISGDVSEAGHYSYQDAAIVPSFDIPSDFIDDFSRQFRISNHTTTDDHGIHPIGKFSNKSGDWFLIKDSGSGARNGKHKGYYFYHSDYIKLKMTTFLVHKDAVKDILSKFN